jgi:hypothetical protein
LWWVAPRIRWWKTRRAESKALIWYALTDLSRYFGGDVDIDSVV